MCLCETGGAVTTDVCVCVRQVVLTVSQLMWCRDITEILEGDFDRLEAMKEFEIKSYQVSLQFWCVCGVCVCVYVCVCMCVCVCVCVCVRVRAI